jgi:PKD repeat protein
MTKRSFWPALARLVVIIGLLASALSAAQTPPAAQASTGKQVVRIYYTSQVQLNALASRLDIWEDHPDKGFAVAMVTPEQYDGLQVAGYRLEIDAEKTAKVNTRAVLDPRFYYFDNYVTNANGLYMVNFLQTINAAYPGLTELIDIGDAWLTTHGGHARNIWALRITNEDPAYGTIASKPVFYMVANIHAREVTTPEMAIRYIKYLLTGYNGSGGYNLDADATWLVNHNVAYIIVSANPDGHVVNEGNTGEYWRKNVDNDDGCTTSNDGVDLNRNSNFMWGYDDNGSSPYACDETYRGPSGGSEPETAAIQNYLVTVMLDQNGPNDDFTVPPAAPDNATGTFLTLHTYSDLVLWPWSYVYSSAPNGTQLTAIGRKIAYYNGFSPDGHINYSVNGSTDDFAYGKLGVASFTIEIGDSSSDCGDFFPSYNCMDGINSASRNFWAENRPVFILLHKLARTPYITIFGPDAENLSLTSGVAVTGTQVTLQATLADHRYGSDALTPVAGAEYFIDTPGADGAGTAMTAADGSWNSASESGQAIIDTTNLSAGRHYILVHGKSNQGKWGPFTAIFLYIAQPGVSPVLEGFVRDAANNAPLAATVKAGTFQTTTDPATGYYSMLVISDTYSLSASAAGHATLTVNNIQAHNYATVQQDFYLNKVCTIYSNNVENGIQSWTYQAPWAITTESAHSATHSWTDSPGGNYTNNRNISLTSPVINFSGYANITLSFWHKYITETGWDYGYVEYSTNGGSAWNLLAAYNGSSPNWSQVSLPIAALANQANAKLRFRFYSDGSQTYDGWHVDDILFTGSGAACNTPLAPSAEFTHTTPSLAREPVRFIDLTLGTPPLQHAWDFGDGLGVSSASDPLYTYAHPGVYTVTLTITNSLGVSSVSHAVIIEPNGCEALTALALTQNPPGALLTGTPAAYLADIFPGYATKPYTYTVDYGDGVSVTAASSLDPLPLAHNFASAGLYPVQVSAWNACTPQPVTASVQTEVADVLYGVAAHLDSPALSGGYWAPVTYTLRITNTGSTTDTFDLDLTSAWNVTIYTPQGPLAPGQSLTLGSGEAISLQLVVTIPYAMLPGASDNAALTITSQGNPARLQTVQFTTTASWQTIFLPLTVK